MIHKAEFPAPATVALVTAWREIDELQAKLDKAKRSECPACGTVHSNMYESEQRLRAERAEAKLNETQTSFAVEKGEIINELERAEAERDALRALLAEARETISPMVQGAIGRTKVVDIAWRIDAALGRGEG